MRKFGIAIVIVIVVIVAVLAIAPHMINVNRYHDKIQNELSAKLGRPVQLGAMSLSLLPPKFTVQNATIGEDPTFSTGRPFAQMQSMAVRVKLFPLLHKDVQIQSLTLERPQVELVRNAQGTWNFSTLGKSEAATTPAPAQPEKSSKTEAPKKPEKPSPAQQPENAPQQTGSSGQNFQLANLKINDGTLAITDEQKHQARAVYDHIDASLEDFAPDKAFTMYLAAHLPGSGAQLAKLEGKVGPINQSNMIETPIDGKMHLDHVSLAGAQRFLNSNALENTDAIITGSADVKNTNGKLQSKGSLKFDDARVHGTDIGYPVTVDYDVADDLANDFVQVSSANLKLGNTPVSLSGTVNQKSTPALADLQVKANDVSISEMARLAGAFGVAFNPGMQVTGRVNANIHAQGALNSPALNGSVAARDLTMSGGKVPAPVKVAAIDLQLTPQQIQSNQFTATAGNTSLTGRFTMSQYTSKAPIIDANLKTLGANVSDVLSMAQAAGISAADGASGSGSMWLDVHAVGPMKDASAMRFDGTGSLQNASIKTATMTQPLVVHAAALKFSQNAMNVTGLNATLGSTNATGTMTARNFQAPQVQFTLAADKLDVVQLQKIMGTPAANAPAAPTRTSWLRLVPRADAAPAVASPSLMNKTTGSGVVTVGDILYNQLELKNTKANVTLNHGVITMNPVNTLLYGGTATGTITVDTRGATTLYNVALKTQKVDSNRLLSSVSSVKDVLYGLLASNLQSSFASGDGTEIAKTLNGHVSMNVNDGKLAKVDILRQLATIGKFSSFNQTAQDFTNLQQLGGDFDIRNGVATTNNLKALIAGGTLAATGAVDLVDQSLNMRLTAVLSKSYSQQVGGNAIGGFMNTALANNKGELVIPVLVTGTFSDMHFAPDVQAIAQMKMNNLLPSFGNPGQLTTGLLGAITGKKGSGENNQAGIGGIIDAITGKPKPNQQYQQQPGAAAENNGAAQQNQQQQANPQDVVNGIVGLFNKNKKQQQQQQQQPPPQNPPPANQQNPK